jgi:hypothetical protein
MWQVNNIIKANTPFQKCYDKAESMATAPITTVSRRSEIQLMYRDFSQNSDLSITAPDTTKFKLTPWSRVLSEKLKTF